jgi:hypothetical protein
MWWPSEVMIEIRTTIFRVWKQSTEVIHKTMGIGSQGCPRRLFQPDSKHQGVLLNQTVTRAIHFLNHDAQPKVPSTNNPGNLHLSVGAGQRTSNEGAQANPQGQIRRASARRSQIRATELGPPMQLRQGQRRHKANDEWAQVLAHRCLYH